MKHFTSPSQKTGELGEKIALKFLMDKGFTLIERNYTKRVGEIDIVAQKDGIIHFIEVKTIVSRETFEKGLKNEVYNPFQNISPYKLRKFSRTIQWFLVEKRVSHETLWQVDAIAVTVSRETRSAKVEVLWKVIA